MIVVTQFQISVNKQFYHNKMSLWVETEQVTRKTYLNATTYSII